MRLFHRIRGAIRAWVTMRRSLAAAEANASYEASRADALQVRLDQVNGLLADERQITAQKTGELEVLNDQLKVLVAWQATHLERLKTEAHIAAARRAPPKRPDDDGG